MGKGDNRKPTKEQKKPKKEKLAASSATAATKPVPAGAKKK